MLEPFTAVVTTKNVTEEPPPVTVSFGFPASLLIGLLAGPSPIPPAAAVPAPIIVHQPEDEMAEPKSPE